MKGCFNCALENRYCPWDGTYHHRDKNGDVIQICNGFKELSGSILISIRPNWTAPIKELKKKWEIRKTIPKLKPPFKCYIYETLGKMKWDVLEIHEDQGGGVFDIRIHEGCGKVIGEFICDRIVEVGYSPYPNHGTYICEVENIHEESCVDFEAMFDYIADGFGYALHIADLIIYDQAKDLSEFKQYCYKGCDGCEYRSWDYACGGGEREMVCTVSNKKPIRRAPQSWCYCTPLQPALSSRRIQ